ncbi:hypothetical protein [Paraburkholderia sp. Cpub6]|uniref:hypothetical protein n=1 Tax=Paraburkholderia sp. Cpub6 TaxID=2723094 RepID=UPI001609036A|nr:hypothetical protein [Paraburkholderia sp. Cpub6]MBB5461037.1 hypothetical protein [Paraburkholderia sp. Cpub6]
MSNQGSDMLAEARKTVRVREVASVARAESTQRKRAPLPTRMRGVAAVALACASLVGCASSTDVVASGKPGSYTVAASATGGRMAWARAHELAMNEARDYCDRRGMQSSVNTETVSGVSAMTEHGSSVSFECHPRF